jgi:prepilin-type N-terminal cleavage/methylation domain-containing protein/prepilin-type processing-associated H-X9-DG protein
MNVQKSQAFTLIELLVVIAIIAILAAILFPVFAQAKVAAKKTANLSNLKQQSIAIAMYTTDHESYPMMSSPSTMVPRMRWVDAIFPYLKSADLFRSPLASQEMFRNVFAHNAQLRYGGYGYNFQYLGNSRFVTGNPNFPFTANESQIGYPAETVAITDTQGIRNAANALSGVYVIDPPLSSARGSGKPSGYYGDGSECGPIQGCRALPAEWATGRVTIAWCDGHANTKPRSQLDDKDGNGVLDNGFYNGQADANSL